MVYENQLLLPVPARKTVTHAHTVVAKVQTTRSAWFSFWSTHYTRQPTRARRTSQSCSSRSMDGPWMTSRSGGGRRPLAPPPLRARDTTGAGAGAGGGVAHACVHHTYYSCTLMMIWWIDGARSAALPGRGRRRRPDVLEHPHYLLHRRPLVRRVRRAEVPHP